MRYYIFRNMLYRISCTVLVSVMFASLTGCQSVRPVRTEPIFTEARLLTEREGGPTGVYDPLEGFNRVMYKFNSKVDNYLLIPVVKGYQWVLPDFAETGVRNFFANIGDIPTVVYQLLQLKGKPAFETTTRIVCNTTVGVLGLFDVATAWNIPSHKEDFGQTLGHYGVGAGPYLVLPLLGPSTLRDSSGYITDAMMFDAIDLFNFEVNEDLVIPYNTIYTVAERANVNFRYYETGSPYEYELVRRLYCTMREIEIGK